eukprot:scaffold803_cov310-Pinguiococcus_pyrenoidosus.AAC.94
MDSRISTTERFIIFYIPKAPKFLSGCTGGPKRDLRSWGAASVAFPAGVTRASLRQGSLSLSNLSCLRRSGTGGLWRTERYEPDIELHRSLCFASVHRWST